VLKRINTGYVRSAASWGGLFGLALYLFVGLVLTLVGIAIASPGNADPTQNPALYTLGCFQFLLLLFTYSAAGYYAGLETARASVGALAGAITFGVYWILSIIYLPVGTSSTPTTAPASQVSAATVIISNLIVLLISLGIAAGLGWLGGRAGAGRTVRPVQAEELAGQTIVE
jgi:hypothetical protein